jgi:mono/diheme cytochrome c family protein
MDIAASTRRVLPMRLGRHSVVVVAILSVVFLLLAAPEGGAQESPSPAAAPDAAKGKRLFIDYGCYRCHGYEGQGGSGGVRLVPRVVPLIGLIAYVRQPTGQMPPYTRAVASDADLADIEAYLRQIPPPPPVASIPILNQ